MDSKVIEAGNDTTLKAHESKDGASQWEQRFQAATPHELDMVRQIMGSEKRPERGGKIRVFPLRKDDGGGKYEVAGVNEKHHRQMAERLKAMVESGKHEQAEREAMGYILMYTDEVALWTEKPGMEYMLRDAFFNRGRYGTIKMLQMAHGLTVDGKWGPETRGILKTAELNQEKFFHDFMKARMKREPKRPDYEQGMNKRWGDVSRNALRYLDESRRQQEQK